MVVPFSRYQLDNSTFRRSCIKHRQLVSGGSTSGDASTVLRGHSLYPLEYTSIGDAGMLLGILTSG